MATMQLLTLVMVALATGQVRGSEHVTYIRGSMPLVLTVPHGGSRRPSALPERSNDINADYSNKNYCGKWLSNQCVYDHSYDGVDACDANPRDKCKVSFYKDSNTREIAMAVAARIKKLTGLEPHLVILEVHRSRVDVNREKDEATFGHSLAEQIYEEYHAKIREVKASFGSSRACGLDIHGQTHSHNKVELGYGVYSHLLRAGDLSHTTINGLLSRSCSTPACRERLLRGHLSLGAFLSSADVQVVPSPKYPSPLTTERYYSGGHTVRTHNSADFDFIQVEAPKPLRQGNSLQTKYAHQLASAALKFLVVHDFLFV